MEEQQPVIRAKNINKVFREPVDFHVLRIAGWAGDHNRPS